MNHFQVFEITDIAESAPIGEVVVKPDGKLELSPTPGSPHVERLRLALAEVAAAKALPLRERKQSGTGDDAASVLTIRDVAPGDVLYGWAVSDALRSRHGFLSAAVR